jgi:peptidoglycan/xylan/chitin deacetylase (PgdA/CDA1 family)
MSAGRTVPNAVERKRWLRQLIVGMVMLPLSILPFMAYFHFTQEGRLLWAQFRLSLSKPHLPELSPPELAWARAHAPSYEGSVALLVYHGIGPTADEDGGFSVPPDVFAEQLATLKAAGMHTVTAREVALAFSGKSTLPSNAVMISFDDGRTDAMMYADPLLEQAGMRATMFVITHAAEDPGIYYVGWDKLSEYAADGRWDLESHSANSHHEQWVGPPGTDTWLPALTSLLPRETIDEYTDRVYGDLRVASQKIDDEIGQTPMAFAYPFGAHGTERTNDPRIEDIVRGAVSESYSIGFDQDDQSTWGLATCHDDPYSLRRLEIGEWSGRTLLGRIDHAARQLSDGRSGERC